MQGFLQREQIVGGRDRRGVSTARPEREFLRIGKYVRVRIDGAGRTSKLTGVFTVDGADCVNCALAKLPPPGLAAATAPPCANRLC
jgi:hypothetical protein